MSHLNLITIVSETPVIKHKQEIDERIPESMGQTFFYLLPPITEAINNINKFKLELQ